MLNNLSAGSTFNELSKKALVEFPLPNPKIDEQRKIAEILSGVDHKLGLQKKRKEKLVRIKQGLMNDLLTGRKRLNV